MKGGAPVRIGILTYHRAENYGALLQSYGLLTYLRSMGLDVSFVDYWPDYHKDYFRIIPRYPLLHGSIKTKAASLYLGLIWGIPRLKRKRVFESFMHQYLHLPKRAEYPYLKDTCTDFDIVVYGSDQIWRRQGLPGHRGVDFWYFGSDNIRAKKIAYAASMGPNTPTDDETSRIKRLLEGFESLSVRESSLHNYLEALNLESKLVVDPVFLLPPEQWRELSAKVKVKYSANKYILFYNLLGASASSQFANMLSRKTNLPIVEVTKQYGLSYLGSRYSHSAAVPEFLSLIDNAAYVVSNSFHGVAMSVIFHKQFYAVGLGKRGDRIKSLLDALGIQSRFFESTEDYEISDIDYSVVEVKMKDYVEASKCYLEEAISNISR